MHIIKMPSGYKPVSRFIKISQNDTVYALSTEKYDVTLEYASSNFYAPSFYYVTVKDKEGKIVWNGGKSVFLEYLFSCQFISDRYDKMILNRVNDTSNSKSQQMIWVDLPSGTETELTGEGFYGSFGHFENFDAVFFNEVGNRITCLDFERNVKFDFSHLLETHFPGYTTWGLSPIRHAVMVLTPTKENNLVLFDLYKEEVIDQCTLAFGEAERVNFTFGIPGESETRITVSYSNKAANGYFAHAGTDYFTIQF